VADNGWLESLLPVRALTFEMRYTETTTPGFFHQAGLSAWIRRLLGSPADYDLYLTIDVPEQGRRRYRAGDCYRFSVLGLGETGEAWIRKLALLLHGGDIRLHWDAAMPFRNNWALEQIFGWPESDPLSLQDTLPCISMAEVVGDIARLRGQRQIGLRLTSPWRILRGKQEREHLRGELRYCRNIDHLHADANPLWLMRIGDALRGLAQRRGVDIPVRQPLPHVDAVADLFWVDASYSDASGHKKPMGGLLGEIGGIDPDQLSDDDLMMLVIGQYTGIGQRRSFGYGRYQLLDEQRSPLFARHPATPLLEQALSDENLLTAKEAVGRNSEADDYTDEFSIEDAEECGEGDDVADLKPVRKLAGKLLAGTYQAPLLNGFVHEDADGGLRPLAAPPFNDRVLQRAVHQLLAPMLDGVMDQGSFGFRAGRSRYQVRDLIQRLYREGYRWVFESDIHSFFDSVAWPHLDARLHSLFGDDPVVESVMAWMRAPVRWQGRVIGRDRGLPQGAPLSPLLANLMLDDFDHDLSDAGCRLIRFADDFVIVARTQAVAEAGGALARQALLDVGLTMKDEKTHIVPFSEGFRFLGFLFVDGMAVESKPERSADAGQPPPQSWLARAMDDAVAPAREQLLRGEEAVALAPYQEGGRVLIFCGEPALLFTRSGRLCIERDNVPLHQAPWAQLDAVILFGRHQVTTPALHAALEAHVSVHLATGGGRYLGCVSSARSGADQAAGWLQQQRMFSDVEWAMPAARSLVDARIRHMAETLRRRGGISDSVWKPALDAALRSCAEATGRDELNGVEGSATRTYFGVIRELVPASFGFESRQRRPPPDPFNALLSFGYTLLYARVESLLQVDGLLPVCGFYHQSHGHHAALASDLMEPFRHVVEREALKMVCGKRLHEDDFSVDDRGCRLSAPARRIYLSAISEALQKPVKGHGGGEAISILEHIHRQNLHLRFVLAGKSDAFSAWRMR